MKKWLLILLLVFLAGCKVVFVVGVHKDWGMPGDPFPVQSSAEWRFESEK